MNESSKNKTMKMNYFSSDRLDDLAAITAKILKADPQPGIIEPEIFLVQNPGITSGSTLRESSASPAI